MVFIDGKRTKEIPLQGAVLSLSSDVGREDQKNHRKPALTRESTQKVASDRFGVRHATLPRRDVNCRSARGRAFPNPGDKKRPRDLSNGRNVVDDGYFLKPAGAKNALETT
jgi:hypothetical protein